MKKRNILTKSLLNGLFQSLTLYSIGESVVSIYTQDFSLNQYLFLTFAAAVISAILYFILIHEERNNKNLFLISLFSFLWFLLGLVVLLIGKNIIPLKLFSQRAFDNSDGIVLLILFGTWMITSIVLHLAILLIFIVRNYKKMPRENTL